VPTRSPFIQTQSSRTSAMAALLGVPRDRIVGRGG
jgi:hypothetical protein